jgi:hypothetical protein
MSYEYISAAAAQNPDDPTLDSLLTNITRTTLRAEIKPGTRIIRSAKCIRPKYGDGEYDPQLKRYRGPVCKKKDCPRHWRRYASKRAKELTECTPERKHWHHVILHCRRFIQKKERFTNLSKWMDKVRKLYPSAFAVAVKHRSKSADHIHVTLGTDEEVNVKALKRAWQAHFPNKAKEPFRGGFVRAFKRDCPRGLIRYALLGRWSKQRKECPWRGIPGKPIVIYRSAYPRASGPEAGLAQESLALSPQDRMDQSSDLRTSQSIRHERSSEPNESSLCPCRTPRRDSGRCCCLSGQFGPTTSAIEPGHNRQGRRPLFAGESLPPACIQVVVPGTSKRLDVSIPAGCSGSVGSSLYVCSNARTSHWKGGYTEPPS